MVKEIVIMNNPPIIIAKIILDATWIPKKLVIGPSKFGNKVKIANIKHIKYHIIEYLMLILFFLTNKVITTDIKIMKTSDNIFKLFDIFIPLNTFYKY